MKSLSAIAFVGQNANGILAWWTTSIAERMQLHGISVHVIDMLQQDWPKRLDERLRQGPPNFCFSFQGFGMHLTVDNGNVWSNLKIPFVSSMGDAPYHAPALHSADGEGLIHLYTSRDFYEFYRDFLKGPNIAAVLPFGYPANPYADAQPWAKRDLDMVFVKTGVDPESIRAQWAQFPPKLRSAIEEGAALALTHQEKTIGQIMNEAFAAQQIHWGKRLGVFLHSCQLVDTYVRAVRADRMARQIMRLGGHIFGDWPHLDKANSRARFHGTIPATELNKLYGRTRVLVNTAPGTRAGMHERILAAFMAKSFIIADTSAYLDDALKAYPSFRSVPIDSDEFSDAMNAHLTELQRRAAHDDGSTQAVLDEVQIRAEEEFGLDRFINGILDFLFLHVIETRNAFYAFPR